MKLIIDIPEEKYKEIMTYKEGCAKLGYFETIIVNGTPLDKIKAEIEKWAEDTCVMEHGCGDEVLQIIDKYGEVDE